MFDGIMVSGLTVNVCRVICSCQSLTQLTAAERYMIFAGKDLTELVEAKRAQLAKRANANRKINKAMNDKFNALATRRNIF